MSDQYNEADDFFGGAASFSFKETFWRGKPRGGMVIKPPVKVQQRDFDTGKPKFYDDGNPMMQLVVTLDTTKGPYPEKDPNNPADDGVRRLFIKGQMVQAFGQAFRKAGAPGFRVGGVAAVCWYGDEPQKKGNPKKLYSAQWTPPAPGFEADSMFEQPAAQQPPAPAPQTAPPAADPWAQAPQQPPAAQPGYQAPAYAAPSPAQQPAPAAPPVPAAAPADPFAATPQAAAPQQAPNPFA